MDNTSKNLDEMPKKSPLSFQIDLKKFEKATDDEKKQQDVMSESTSFFKDGMRKLRKNPLAMGCLLYTSRQKSCDQERRAAFS